VTAFVRRRHADVPRADEMAVRVVNRPLDRLDGRRVRDVVNLDVNRIQDGEHVLEPCKSGTRGIPR